jgi:hypothetical protein
MKKESTSRPKPCYTPLNCNKIIDILDFLKNREQLTPGMSEKFVINIIKNHSLYDVEELQWIIKKHICKENEENIKTIIKGHHDKDDLNKILFN